MLNKLVSEDKPNLSKRENTKLPKRLPWDWNAPNAREEDSKLSEDANTSSSRRRRRPN